MRLLAVILVVAGCDPRGPAPRSPNPKPVTGVVAVDTIARGLSNPWGLEFLPDGRMIVTERPGSLRIIDRNGKISEPLSGVPAVGGGQGGLLDVAIDPAFATNNIIYLSFAEPAPDGTAGTSVARAHLGASGLDDVGVIYSQQPKVKGGNHFGSRIVFARDGTMWITQGERFDYREQAQDLGSDLGKIVRVNSDGSIPRDNPFVSRAGARPEIWSYGHRNIQAAAMDPATGQLWTVEHGAKGGDELNHPAAGKNYGWPVISYGRNYNGSAIGEGAVKAGMEQPVYYWDPVIAPSGMVFYTGDKFPQWRGNIFVGGLASQALVRLVLENGVVAKEERYLHGLHERIRDVRQGNDGYLYLITDSSNGLVLRVRPEGLEPPTF
ncbi:MAG TPA: PQQ-dependent sugar dehydrogenase [Gemmatimonadaceae bacterium]|nr:PQQ-dependent sugar dehydrogenase [Gemmatimonadaceae bacterium]